MNMKNTKTKYNNEKGQTLLFVIVAVTIAMAVGVSVSTRTIQSLKRVARTDTSARVIAAAEGGIENLLSRSYSQLSASIGGGDGCESIGATPGPEAGTCSYVFTQQGSEEASQTCVCTCEYCGSEKEGCENVMGVFTVDENQPEVKASTDLILEPVEPGDIIPIDICEFPCSPEIPCDGSNDNWCQDKGGAIKRDCEFVERETNTGDLISSRAVVKVETFSTNEDGSYSFDLAPGEVREIFLGQDYDEDSVLICWDDSGNSDGNAAVYYYSYNQDGDILKGGLRPTDSDFSCPGSLSNLFVVEDADRDPYEFCGRVELVEDAYGLRIKVLFNSSRVSVSTTMPSVPLPTQGYKLTSRGEIVTGSGSEEKATVIVHKSYPYAPDIFDYGIYTPATLSGSN